ADQLAQQREIIDLLRQLTRRQQAAPVRREPGEVAGAAQLLNRRIGLEVGLQRDRSDDHLPVEQHGNLLEDPGVQRLEKVFGPNRNRQLFENAVVDQNRPEER